MATKEKEAQTIEVLQLSRGTITVHVEGISPLIMNRMTEKAKREFLLPARKKNRAERETTLKHDPLEEFRASAHRLSGDGPTLVMFPGVAFKAALRSATADMPGATKAAIGRLTYIEQEEIPIYGTPQVFGRIVKQGGISRTPDMRFRAIYPQWAARFEIIFQQPLLNHRVVANLMAAAGEIIGIGDYRTEKGAGSYGRFRLIDKERFEEVIAVIGARPEQENAFQNPEAYDLDTRDLIDWFVTESQARGLKPKPNGQQVNT